MSCICINTLWPSDVIMVSVNFVVTGSGDGLLPARHQAITWTSSGIYCQLDPEKQSLVKFESKYKTSTKCIWKCLLQNGSHFLQTSICFCFLCDLITIGYVTLVAIGYTTKLEPCGQALILIWSLGTCTFHLLHRWLSGKLWYLQNNYVGDTIVYH